MAAKPARAENLLMWSVRRRAQVYAHEWKVDAVKDDGCGDCPDHDPFAVMSKELNATGRHIFLSIHGDPVARPEYAATSNMWRVGDDLWDSSYDMCGRIGWIWPQATTRLRWPAPEISRILTFWKWATPRGIPTRRAS